MQLAAEQKQCRQEGERGLHSIGGGEARSDMTTKRLAELDERDHQLEQRIRPTNPDGEACSGAGRLGG